jgi:hypothetical protein
MAVPYQPSLLRLLHGATGLVAAAAWLSGLLLYNQFDGRWGRLPLPEVGKLTDMHGIHGVVLILVSALFVPYAFTLGRRRLNRAANALPLLALLLALGSGLFMNEHWLEDGQFQHLPYHLHLLAWLLFSLAVLLHLLSLRRRGGPALLASMLSLRLKPGDGPQDWPNQLRRFFGFP